LTALAITDLHKLASFGSLEIIRVYCMPY